MNSDTKNHLQEIKTATGWTQSRIAAEIGTSQATVNRLLKGAQLECMASTSRSISDLYSRVKRSSKRRTKSTE